MDFSAETDRHLQSQRQGGCLGKKKITKKVSPFRPGD